jgi:PAS domain S-box-containing protein
MEAKIQKPALRILHLEDDENDHFLVVEKLRADGLVCEFFLARSKSEFAEALNRAKYDLIISDFSLPSYDGLSALSLAQELHAETPFIFFSGTIGEDIAVESLRNGAVDYVLKQRPNRLSAAVRRALRNFEEHARLKKSEQALRQSEERLRIVAKATNDVIWEWDMANDRVWFSENFPAAFGHKIEPGITSESWFDFIHPDDKQPVLASVAALLASGGRVWWSEYRLRHDNGSYAHIFDRASIVYDHEGRAQSMVGIKIDVSERKRAEEKIREQAALLDKARDAIIVCDLDRKITFWNQGAERIYGWSAEEATGKDIRQLLFEGEISAQIMEALKSLDERGEWMGELRETTKSGKSIIVQARSTVICDEHGRPKAFLLINTDITEHKQLEEQFLRAQRLESLGVLVSGIAHDLNNTLVPIMIGVEILQREALSEDAVSMVQTMGNSARRSAEMIKQMLMFARGGETSKTLVQPGRLLKEIGKVITDTFPKSIHCDLRLGKDLHPLFCVSTQLHQVLMNLCVNARDAMSEQGTLTMSAENVILKASEAAGISGASPGSYVCVSVADTGQGIPPEQLGKIFLPFFTTKAPGKGTGLGLSTCHSIIKNHDGFITVRSVLKSGSEFKVYLPGAGVKSIEPTNVPTPALPAGKGERILMVDDEESILAMTRAALENYGYTISTAVSGMEAIARFHENPNAFDLVITDLAMPFMDGNVIISALRKIRPEIKIIATSGSEKEAENMLQNLPADGFISKPFTTEKLLNAIRQTL